jgi:hypothetical protein
VKLQTIDDERTSLIANYHQLRLYQKMMSKEEFVQDSIRKEELKFASKVVRPHMTTSSLFYLLKIKNKIKVK